MSSAVQQAPARHASLNLLAVGDKRVKACQRCGSAFSLLHRAHHCRKCQLAVCAHCSSRTLPLDGRQQRVCDACFNQGTLSTYNREKEQAEQRSKAAATTQGRADAPLQPPPKRETRKPLKLAIPASLSYLQPTPPAVDTEAEESQSFTSPLSPSFAASVTSPSSTSTSTSTTHSNAASSFSSPGTSPSHSQSEAAPPPLRESQVNLPSVPSVAALNASPAFASFKTKLAAFHSSIATSEGEWERRLEKRLRAERPGLRDNLARVSSIVEAMKQERQRMEASGATASAEDDERLAYFIRQRQDYARRLDTVDLDIHFADPTMRRFKVRVNAADERISIAAEDVALERVSGVFKAGVRGNHMRLELSDVLASAIVYHFSLSGKGTRMWGHFVKPERVSLQLTIRKILIPVTYHHTRNPSDVGRWTVDRAAAVFDIHVVKSIKGGASVPDSVIAWIINQQVPKAVLGAFDDLIPGEVGQLFSGHADHHVTVEGAFDVHCAFSNAVWEADLCGNNAESESARQLIVVPGSQQAATTSPGLLYARMHMLNNVIVAGRLHKLLPSVSLRDIAGYIRRFSCSVDETAQALWLKLLTEWQLQLNELEGSQTLWFFHLIERVAELDDKPLVFHLGLNKVSVGVGVVNGVQWYLDSALKAVRKKMEEEKQRRSGGGATSAAPTLRNGSRHHTLVVPSRTAGNGSAPSSPLTGNSVSTNSPSSKRSVASVEDDNAEVDSLSHFIGDADEKDNGRAKQTSFRSARPRSSSHPELESPRASVFSQAIHIDRSEAAPAEETPDLSDIDPESMMKVALEWRKTVQASLAASLDIVQSLSLTVAGQLTGGPLPIHPAGTDDAQVTLWVSRLDTKLSMPPLKVTIGALEMIKERIVVTPELKIATRVNPQTGCLESLTQLTDPATGLRYTYHFSFAAGALNLFPALLAHQQQRLFSSSLDAPPALTFTLDEVRLEGSIKPAMEISKYIQITEKQNVIRAAGSAAEKAAEVEAQDQEERLKQSLLSLIKGNDGVDVAAILLPYVLSKVHDMKVVVKLQIKVLNNDAATKVPASAAAAAPPSTAAAAPAASATAAAPASAAHAYLATASSAAPTVAPSAAPNGAAAAAAVAATLPALAIPEDKESASHTSGSNSASAVGSVTSISLLSSSSSSLAISTAELQEKLGRYRTVVLSVDTPSASRSQAIDVAREQKGEEAPSSIVLHKSQEVMEAEDICVDVSFKATLAELITDILQLTLA